MRVLWRFMFRAVRTRPGRTMLTLLSIVIGVAAVVAVMVSTRTAKEAYKELYQSVAGRAALEVVPKEGRTFDQRDLPGLAEIEGVQAVLPSVQQTTILSYGEEGEGKKRKKIHLMVLGVDLKRDQTARDYELVEGRFPTSQDGLVMEVEFARGLGLKLNDEPYLMVARHGPQHKFRIEGLLTAKGVGGFNQGGIAIMPLEWAQYWYTPAGHITHASIVLDDGAGEAAVRDAIAEMLPPAVIIRSPASRVQLASETLLAPQQGLLLACLFMIAEAAVMILNTFMMNISERRRQVSILRAVGTTRPQIMGMLLAEGLFLGILGTAIGMVIGIGLAHLMSSAMSRVYGTAANHLVLTPVPFIVAGVVGPVMSVISMLIPAWIASRVSPLEGMRPAITTENDDMKFIFRCTLIGVIMFVLFGSVMTAAVMGYLPPIVVTCTGVFVTLSVVLLIPAMLGFFSRLAAVLLSPIIGAEGRIACRQLLRRRMRTTLTIGVLYMVISVTLSLGMIVINNVNDVRDWQSRTTVGDFVIRPMFADPNSGYSVEPMPEDLRATFASMNGVEDIDSLRLMSGSVRGQPIFIAMHEFQGKNRDQLRLVLQNGDPDEVRRRVIDGEVVIGSNLAQRVGVHPGEYIDIEVGDREKTTKSFRIAATATEYMVGGFVVHMDREAGKKILGVGGVDAYVIRAKPDDLKAVETELRNFCDDRSLMLQSFADLRSRIEGMANAATAPLWGVLLLGFVVSAFGTANTLTMNVLEQTRELALLRVVAASRWQVRKTILAQALLIGCLGLFAGLIGGMIGCYVNSAVSLAVVGRPSPFVLHPTLIFGSMALSMITILLAAFFPAERAARLNLLIALQYE